MSESIPWQALSEVYAFVGNSLLKPMSMTPTVGLDPEFWSAFPTFDDAAVAQAVGECAHYAEEAEMRVEQGEDESQRASVEYTRLFVGPPSPLAPPWETMYRGDKEVTVGFGQATFEMRELLHEAGLQVTHENNQYEDHMGIELLYLSELCRSEAGEESAVKAADIAAFIGKHPLAWVEAFRGRVSETAPQGYFVGLLLVVQRVLEHHAKLLAS